MEIKSSKYNHNQIQLIIFEHFILTILTWLLSVIGLFYISGKSESKASYKGNTDFRPLTFLLEHSIFYLIFGLIITLLVNIFYMFKKRHEISTRAILFNDNSKIIIIEYKKRYSNKFFQRSYKYSDLGYTLGKRTAWMSSNDFHFIQLKDNEKFIGEIFLADIIWDNDTNSYRKLKNKLNEIIL